MTEEKKDTPEEGKTPDPADAQAPAEAADTHSADGEATALETAQAEAAEMKVRYLRSVADLENYRKRITREKQDLLRNAAGGVIEALLPVLDTMTLGLEAAGKHPEATEITAGFKMVDEQMKKALADQGLETLMPDGDAFDPNLHECIAHQPSENVPEDTVIQTVRAGYKLNDRLLRAANVVVSSGPAEADS